MKNLSLFIIISLLSNISFAHAADSTFDFLLKNDKNYQDVKVQDVISADTIIIETYAKKGERIHLAGLKAPETPERKRANRDVDKYGFPIEEEVDPLSTIEDDAFNFVKELLKGKKVRLEFDRIKKNDRFETLAYVFIVEDNTFVNAEILRQGFAEPQIIPENKKYSEELYAAYQEAHREKRGLQGQ